jgi:DNA-directed RNA polymerase
MRFSECKVQERLIKYSDLSRVFNVINGLAQTPWKINKRVLEVI